jgi:addiction module HigA family antidote
MSDKLIPLEHPGTILKEEFMVPFGITAYRLSKDTGISNMAISEIVRGKRSITPRVAIRLSKYFGVSEGYFSRLQLPYDLDLIKEKEGGEVDKIHPFLSQAQQDSHVLAC